jgi:transposase-like protein
MYEELNKKDFLNSQAAAKLLSGLSTRRFQKTVDQLFDSRGISRQTISDRGVQEMTLRLEEFQTRSLDGVDILVLFIDGIHLGDEVYIAAVGIDTTGKKHVLGFEAGSTENHGVCRALLSNMISRGILSAEGGFLCVIDGGTGVRKAVNDLYGKRVYIQRCTVHKKRNVNDKLPKKFHEEFIHKFNSAFNKPTLKEAEQEFQKLRGWLSTKNERAANSLTEGLREILTLHRLGVKGMLRRTLSTTNCIESVFSAARYYTRNVKRWRKAEQMDRWIASGLLEAEQRLRRVPGYTQLGKLKQAIRKDS